MELTQEGNNHRLLIVSYNLHLISIKSNDFADSLWRAARFEAVCNKFAFTISKSRKSCVVQRLKAGLYVKDVLFSKATVEAVM